MAHNTFISYKYSEARDVRDRIIDALGDDAVYYKGETSDSPDMTDFKTKTIREALKDMLFDTTVTIVVVSPHMTESKWIDWEIEYSLREYSRNGVKSSPNGLVGVIKKCDGGYGWIKTVTRNADKCRTASFDKSLLYPIIVGNRCNQDPKEYACNKCRSIHWLNGSYMALVEEEKFLEDPRRFIDNAFEKHQKIWNYDLCKTR